MTLKDEHALLNDSVFQFEALQFDLPFGFGPAAVGPGEKRIEWRCAEKVLAEYLEAIGVSRSGPAARGLLAEFGTIPDLLSASWWRLHRVVGARLASTIRASRELMQAALLEPVERGPVVPRSQELVSFLQLRMGFLQRECLIALFVDLRLHLILIETISEGRIDTALVDMRRIVNCGLNVGATGFLLVHNHPSGHPQPSRQDQLVTDRLKALTAELDLHLLDHLIIARGKLFSFDDFWRELEWS